MSVLYPLFYVPVLAHSTYLQIFEEGREQKTRKMDRKEESARVSRTADVSRGFKYITKFF